MKQLYSLLLLIFIIGCNSPKKGNVTITGNIKGLKKGTIYLQKIQDTVLINVDSVIVASGDNAMFTMITSVDEPEIHYLYLDKNDGIIHNDRVDFFVEPGEINITTNVRNFEEDIKIIGGKNETKFQEFKKINKRFNDRNLRLIKDNFEASKQNDDEKLIKNDKMYKNLIKQRYLYTINFALNNKDKEVAPYIILSEVFDANIKYLDTVANSLTPSVKKSLYGKQLVEFIQKRKKEDPSKK
ncbi:DUF4369 domain-containing protein [Aquimarina hainanensis]|uniref:DUF4369 domain-containing protein n=1 Tax=Aquimarina hainanensis TaxID=1578017 RepID=A0ABW5N880_9FLAO|nr:DUF4369 domain-containing protein [Aquimarina sp. TRL1]QKX05662.1 DUF4369 domain-containing protein [Aquimarina sp. TRL1]